jgi:hypothetical protein
MKLAVLSTRGHHPREASPPRLIITDKLRGYIGLPRKFFHGLWLIDRADT